MALKAEPAHIAAKKPLNRPSASIYSPVSSLLPLANREIIVKDATAEITTVTAVNSKRNFTISIFSSVSGLLVYLERQSHRTLDGNLPSLVLSAF